MQLGLPRVVQALGNASPPVSVKLEELGTPDILRRVREGPLHAGLIAGTAAGREFDLLPVARLRFLVMAPRGLLRGRGEHIDLAELDGLTLLSPAAQEPAHQPLLDAIREHASIRVQDAFGIDTIRALVSGGVGVSLAPRLPGSPRPETVEMFATDPPLPDVQVSLATLTSDRSRPVAVLRRLVAEHMVSTNPPAHEELEPAV